MHKTQGGRFPPICIPQSDAAGDTDDEECVYDAICSAAEALRRVCPECILNQQDSCKPVPPDDDLEEQRKRNHLETTCLKLTGEQSDALTMLAKFRNAPHDAREMRFPDLNLNINGWSIDGPLSWSGVGESSRLELERHKGRLEQVLERLPEFHSLCPFANEEDGKTELVSGICGGFRNPDPASPPPRVRIRP